MSDLQTPAPSAAERLVGRPIATEKVTLALDPNDRQRLLEARSRVDRAADDLRRADAAAGRAGADGAAQEKAEAAANERDAADAALEAIESSIVTFTVHVRAIGARRVEDLVLAHRPTDAQRRNAKSLANGDPKAQPEWNADTFPPALLAEAVPLIEFSDGDQLNAPSEQQFTDMWLSGHWPEGDRHLILQTALMINQVSSNVEDLGKG